MAKPALEPISPVYRDLQGNVVVLDSTALPKREIYRTLPTAAKVQDAIRRGWIAGPAAIGVAAAAGLALGARRLPAADGDGAAAEWRLAWDGSCAQMAATRPLAPHLFWAIDRMKAVVSSWPEHHPHESHSSMLRALDAEASRVLAEGLAANEAIGAFGLGCLVETGGDGCVTVLSLGASGCVGTEGAGTALGVVRTALDSGRKVRVMLCESRPTFDDTRLAAWECNRDGIEVTVLPDAAVGAVLRRKLVDVAIVAADTVVANGDCACKVGAYPIAILCKRHFVPFYVTATTSVIDLSIPSGELLEDLGEQGTAAELRTVGTRFLAEDSVPVHSPARDVVPADLVNAYITEDGMAEAPFDVSLRKSKLVAAKALEDSRAATSRTAPAAGDGTVAPAAGAATASAATGVGTVGAIAAAPVSAAVAPGVAAAMPVGAPVQQLAQPAAAAAPPAALVSEIEAIKRENEALKSENASLKATIADLVHQVQNASFTGAGADADAGEGTADIVEGAAETSVPAAEDGGELPAEGGAEVAATVEDASPAASAEETVLATDAPPVDAAPMAAAPVAAAPVAVAPEAAASKAPAPEEPAEAVPAAEAAAEPAAPQAAVPAAQPAAAAAVAEGEQAEDAPAVAPVADAKEVAALPPATAAVAPAVAPASAAPAAAPAP